MATSGPGWRCCRRPVPDADTDPGNHDIIPSARLKRPILLRLTRRGNTIGAAFSRDGGRSFQPAGDLVLFVPALAKPLDAGLAITSHDPTEVCEARFRNLVITKL